MLYPKNENRKNHAASSGSPHVRQRSCPGSKRGEARQTGRRGRRVPWSETVPDLSGYQEKFAGGGGGTCRRREERLLPGRGFFETRRQGRSQEI